jgi:hypothetical protein
MWTWEQERRRRAKEPAAQPGLVTLGGEETAANLGGADYIYWASGGLSWTMPYVLGLYGIVLEIDPALTQDDLRAMIVDTAYDVNGLPVVNPVGFVAAALALTVFALFAASKAFAMRRMVGDGNVVLKLSSFAAVFSALLSAVLALMLAMRLDFNIEWPGAVRTASFSARTREILSGIAHPVRVSACMSRDSVGFLPVARLLRHVELESRSLAGAGVSCEFIDPRWDPNAADRLVRLGASENMIVFSSGRRRIVVSAKDFDERACASAVQRLSMPARSEKVLFTSGHGEPSIDDYGPTGLGDAARALRQDGRLRNQIRRQPAPPPYR